MAELTEEMRVLVTAEVDKCIANMKKVDSQTNKSTALFKAFGKTISATFAIGAMAKFAKESAAAYAKQKETLSVLSQVVRSTGAEAWTSAGELQKMAESLQQVTNYAAGDIEEMQSVLLGFKNINGDNFKDATKAILDMATVMKMDLKSAAQSIGKALDDPIKGMDSLKKQGFNFTESQKAVMKSLLDTGDAAAAQKIILDELSGTFGGAAEASANYFTQLKNSWSDTLSTYAKSYSDLIKTIKGEDPNKESGNFLDKLNKSIITDWDRWWAAQKDGIAGVFGKNLGENYQKWFKNQNFETQFKTAKEELEAWNKTLDEFQAKLGDNKPTKKQQKELENIKSNIQGWTEIFEPLKKAKEEQQALVQAANDQAEAESRINELMHDISKEYEKLGKSDPVIQIETYRKELEKIENDRKKLTVENTTGIDTKAALGQLNQLERAVNKKLLSITINGRKTWQNWLSEITGEELGSFKTGKEAADKFIAGLEAGLTGQKTASEVLGRKFNVAEALEDQRKKVGDALEKLLSIDPAKINDAFKTGDASINALVDTYRKLGKDAGEAYRFGLIDALENEMVISEKLGFAFDSTEAVKQQMGELEAKIRETMSSMDPSQIEAALNDQESELSILIKLWEQYKESAGGISYSLDKAKSSLVDFDTVLEEKIFRLLESLGNFNDKTNAVFSNLATNLANVSFDATLTGLRSLGEAFGKGDDAAESFGAALRDMAKSILDQLPTLFIQAGLSLIANNPSMWTVGLGLVAAGGADAIIGGFVNGYSANAKGGVYGDESYSAFALGGTFTNGIVDKPTFFRFAKGSGFGTGLMGEAGPEAIMPLTRGADGSLGVSVYGGNAGGEMQCSLTVNIHSEGGDASVAQSTDGNGNAMLDVVIKGVDSAISAGRMDRTFKSRFGMKVMGI